MAAALGVDLDVFMSKYARIQEVWEGGGESTTFVSLKEVWNPKVQGHDCVFLDRTYLPGKAICSLYAARPTQCRTWPFW